jgi:hypothetical protein
MAEFLGTPKVQYFDTATGQPLSGGKLYTYEPGAGSTTPKATYSNIADALAATNANSNPVILDSRGEATVVLAGSTKLVLSRSDDTTVWTVDAVGTTGNNIYDPNGNEVVVFSYVNSAVNEVTITNAATTDNPTIQASGGDTNIDLNVLPKGTGGINIGTKIIDANGNEQLILFPVASAVNYLQIANNSTGANPTISVAGDDTNIGIDFTPKGTGKIKLGVLNMPTADGTAGQILNTDASGNLQFSSYNASAAQQEAASSSAVFVTPAVQQRHPSSAKGWVKCGVAGNIISSYNVASISDTATGQMAVNWSTAFSSVDYVVNVTVYVASSSAQVAQVYGQSTGAVNCYSANSSAGTLLDPIYWLVTAYGDQ